MKSIKFCGCLIALALIFNSCSKGSQQPGGGNTPPPTPIPTPTPSDSITVSSFSPSQPYVDDTITINGTNFNPNPTLDTVYFGVITNTIGTNGVPVFAYKVGCQVLSATATQLRVRLATVSGGGDPIQTGTFTLTSPTDLNLAKGFMIAANGKRKIVAVPFKFLPSFSATSYTPNIVTQSNFQRNYAGCIYGTFALPYLFIYEGDSLLLDGYGLSNVSIVVNGKPLSGISVKENTTNKTQHLSVLIPYGFFQEADPVGANRCPVLGTRVLEIKATNLDNKTTTFNKGTYFPSPNTGIYSYGLNGNTFQQSNINLQPLYKIVGYALRSTTQVRVVGTRNGVVIYNQIIGNVSGGYPNEYTFAIDLKALPGPPTGGDVYSVTLIQDGTILQGPGGSGFTLNP